VVDKTGEHGITIVNSLEAAAMSDFVLGKPYFLIKFLDRDLTLPIVQTLLWVETVSNSSGDATILFDQLLDDGTSEKLALQEPVARHLVVDSEELLARLSRCFAGTLTDKIDR
jgi:hypothetical protein